MSNAQDAEIAARVEAAFKTKTPLKIVGGNSKAAYGEDVTGEVLSTRGHRGVTAYEPSELFITARGGTPLTEVEDTLRRQNQMLAFEPPHFGATATVGGCLACGLSGPARVANGAVRDAVLGVTIVNGKGEILRFGGRMIKNVAGYDVGRLTCGALGTLGVILEVTFRVTPVAEFESTIRLKLSEREALRTVREYVRQGVPISASFYTDDYLYLRLSGYRRRVDAVLASYPAEPVADGEHFWRMVKEHQHPFFKTSDSLWRLSLPAASPPLDLPGTQAFEWHGALRWLKSGADPAVIRDAVERSKGHACWFASAHKRTAAVFHPLKPALLNLHRRVKRAFDPADVLNRGRLYPGI